MKLFTKYWIIEFVVTTGYTGVCSLWLLYITIVLNKAKTRLELLDDMNMDFRVS